jgi:hypothetical protein
MSEQPHADPGLTLAGPACSPYYVRFTGIRIEHTTGWNWPDPGMDAM